ncbi:MAG: prolipoprotein diacylglyceryl transferase [Longimicrobiales bacterium]
MIPVLFRIPEWIPLAGGQAITSFGALLLVAFLAGGKLFADGVRADDLEARGWDLVITAAVAGLLGAKAMHLAVNGLLGLPTGLGRAGLDWFGGLAFGGAALLWHARVQGLDPGRVAAAAAAPVALGYAIGRVGSFLVGSEYGVPTTLPWGVAFPAGHPPTTPANLLAAFGLETPAGALCGDFARVHPTQLYEAVLSLGVFAAVRRARHARTDPRGGGWWVAGLFLILHGAARVLVEPVRAKADGLAGPVTVDLVLAAGVVVLGAGLQAWRGANRGKD